MATRLSGGHSYSPSLRTGPRKQATNGTVRMSVGGYVGKAFYERNIILKTSNI